MTTKRSEFTGNYLSGHQTSHRDVYLNNDFIMATKF